MGNESVFQPSRLFGQTLDVWLAKPILADQHLQSFMIHIHCAHVDHILFCATAAFLEAQEHAVLPEPPPDLWDFFPCFVQRNGHSAKPCLKPKRYIVASVSQTFKLASWTCPPHLPTRFGAQGDGKDARRPPSMEVLHWGAGQGGMGVNPNVYFRPLACCTCELYLKVQELLSVVFESAFSTVGCFYMNMREVSKIEPIPERQNCSATNLKLQLPVLLVSLFSMAKFLNIMLN